MVDVVGTEEVLRLAMAQPRVPAEERRRAASAYAALAPQRARLEAAEARYDGADDPDALDEALRAFEALAATDAWAACPADRRAQLGGRVSRLYGRRYERAGAPRDLRASIETAEAGVDAAERAQAALGAEHEAAAAVSELLARQLGGHAGAAQAAMAPLVGPAVGELRAEIARAELAALIELGEQLSAAFDRHSERADIDRAVTVLERARPLDEWSGHAHGAALLLRFKAYGDRADADAAVEAERAALAVARDDGRRAAALDGLGCALLARSEQTGDADLDEAAASLEAATRLNPDSPWLRANLSTALSARFRRGGDHADAQRAEALLESALAEVPPTAPDRARLEQNLAALRGGADLRALVAATPEGARAQPARLGGLASELIDEAERNLHAAPLDEAVKLCRQAADALPPGAVDRPSILHNLGRALATRFALLGDASDLDAGLEALEAAVAAAGPGAGERPDLLTTLASAATMRAARTGAAQDGAAATRHFAAACEAAEGLNATAAVRAAGAWGAWAAEEGDWEQAARAGRLGVAAAERVERAQLVRANRERSFGATALVYREAGIALVRAGAPEEALVTLERGRARLLSDALERDRAELGALERPELAEAYAAASGRVASAEQAGDADAVRAAYAALQAAIDAIRALPGHSGFLAPVRREDIAEAAGEAPIAYVCTGLTGAVVVTALPGGTVEARIVEGLDDYVAAEHYERLQAAREARTADPAGWSAALDDVGGRLGETVWPAVRATLAGASRAVVITTGLVGLLPLQIGWRADASGRRYAVDELELSFAPSARALRACARVAARAAAGSALAVGAPERTDLPGPPLGAAEAAAVLARVGAGEPLAGLAATRAAVLRELPRHGVLHFACHGRARPYEPLESALLLAGEDVLTVRDLLELRLPGTRLAVLSACETAVVGLPLVDEYVGLPSGFLQAGVAGVVATSWEVKDESAALLVRRFFDAWDGGGPAAALRSAQRWVRESSNGEKLDAYPELAQAPPPEFGPEEVDDWRAGVDHAGIEHWGGFLHAGA